MNFFITATDTNVGKTYVGARLAAVLADVSKHTAKLSRGGKKVAYFKPFQSGAPSDIETVTQLNPNITVKNSYVTKTPAAPALSAEIDGVKISLEKVISDYKHLEASHDRVIVEGSGGMLVPVGENLLISDVILALKLPVLIVARPDLGTINHTLLTLAAAKNLGIKVLAVVISNYPGGTKDPVITTAKTYIEQFSDAKVFEFFKDSAEFAPELLSVLK